MKKEYKVLLCERGFLLGQVRNEMQAENRMSFQPVKTYFTIAPLSEEIERINSQVQFDGEYGYVFEYSTIELTEDEAASFTGADLQVDYRKPIVYKRHTTRGRGYNFFADGTETIEKLDF